MLPQRPHGTPRNRVFRFIVEPAHFRRHRFSREKLPSSSLVQGVTIIAICGQSRPRGVSFGADAARFALARAALSRFGLASCNEHRAVADDALYDSAFGEPRRRAADLMDRLRVFAPGKPLPQIV